MPIRPVSEKTPPTPSSMAKIAAGLLEPEDAMNLLNQTDYDRIMPNGLTFEQDRIFQTAHGLEKQHPAPKTRPTHRFGLDVDFELLKRLDAIVAQRRYDERKRSASSRRKVIEAALEAYLEEHEIPVAT